MNTFVLEIFDNEGAYCCFYTVKWESEEFSETEKFFAKYNDESLHKQALQELTYFIFEKIANQTGALESFFRFENRAHALPPSGSYWVEELKINYENFPLRLYCLRISESLVVLFNGAEKTSRSAQGGKTSMVFHEANQFAKRILQALNDKDIHIAKNNREFRSFDGNKNIIL